MSPLTPCVYTKSSIRSGLVVLTQQNRETNFVYSLCAKDFGKFRKFSVGLNWSKLRPNNFVQLGQWEDATAHQSWLFVFGGGWVPQVNGCSIIAGEQEEMTHLLSTRGCVSVTVGSLFTAVTVTSQKHYGQLLGFHQARTMHIFDLHMKN